MRSCSRELMRAAQSPALKSVRRFARLLAAAVARARTPAVTSTGRIADSAIAGAAGVS